MTGAALLDRLSGAALDRVLGDAAELIRLRTANPPGGESTAEGQAQPEAIPREPRSDDPVLPWQVSRAGVWLDPFEAPVDHRLARLALAAPHHDEPGLTFPGGTDAPHLIATGIPTLIRGSGSLRQAHAAEARALQHAEAAQR